MLKLSRSTGSGCSSIRPGLPRLTGMSFLLVRPVKLQYHVRFGDDSFFIRNWVARFTQWRHADQAPFKSRTKQAITQHLLQTSADKVSRT